MPTMRRVPSAFLLLLLLLSATTSFVTSLDFKWTASIDRSTGIAISRETSSAPSMSNLYRAMTSHHQTPSKLVESIFGHYPSWLANWRVTFGCLRAMPLTERGEMKDIAIRDAVFGVTLLSFGQSQFHVTKTNRNNKEYTMVIPIVGGMLALPSSKGRCGALSFSLFQRNGDSSLRLETSIVDGYRPAISGAAPVKSFRAGFYRSTQSLFHAYIMWRFHHYCYHQPQ